MPKIVGGEQIGELASLQPVAEAIFGRGRRGPQWFRRKLAREGVEARLSAVAIEDHAAGTPSILGYALLGRAPSLGAAARGAGVGVVPQARGRGLGRALLAFAAERATAAGLEVIEFLAEPERVGWYRAQGFAVVEDQLTLLGLGRGRDELGDLASMHADPEPGLGPRPLWSWIPEVWARTPAAERRRLAHARGRVWLTRESRAWLVHRVELESSSAADLVELLDALRDRLRPTTPLLLYPCPADAAWLPAVLEAGFDLAQRAQLVRRRL